MILVPPIKEENESWRQRNNTEIEEILSELNLMGDKVHLFRPNGKTFGRTDKIPLDR